MNFSNNNKSKAKKINIIGAGVAGLCAGSYLQMNGYETEMAAIFFIISLADMHRKGSGYPMGGSLNFARQLEKRYLQLGGKIHYDSKMKKILVSQASSGASAYTGLNLKTIKLTPQKLPFQNS